MATQNVIIKVPEQYRDAINRHFSQSDLPSYVEQNKSPYDTTILNWIPWGLCNDLPAQYLRMLEQNSMLLRALSTISTMIIGDGIKITGPDYVHAETFLEEIGLNDKIFDKISWDLALFNAMTVLINKDNSGEIVKVQHLETANIRAGVPNRFGEVEIVYHAPDWAMIDNRNRLRNLKSVRKNKEYYTPVEYSLYSVINYDNQQVYYDRITTPAKAFYPLPPIETCYKALELQNEIIEFHLNSIRHGASSTMVLTYPMTRQNFNSNGNDMLSQQHKFEQSELNQLIDEISDNIKGVQNAGKPLVLTYDPNDSGRAPTIQQFPSSDNDKKWNTLITLNEINILTALGIPSGELIGIPKPTGFSSKSEELLTALEIMRANTVYPLQNLLRDMINNILKDSGYISTVEFLQSTPITSTLSIDDVVNGIVTIDEYREYKLGLDKKAKINNNI